MCGLGLPTAFLDVPVFVPPQMPWVLSRERDPESRTLTPPTNASPVWTDPRGGLSLHPTKRPRVACVSEGVQRNDYRLAE